MLVVSLMLLYVVGHHVRKLAGQDRSTESCHRVRLVEVNHVAMSVAMVQMFLVPMPAPTNQVVAVVFAIATVWALGAVRSVRMSASDPTRGRAQRDVLRHLAVGNSVMAVLYVLGVDHGEAGHAAHGAGPTPATIGLGIAAVYFAASIIASVVQVIAGHEVHVRVGLPTIGFRGAAEAPPRYSDSLCTLVMDVSMMAMLVPSVIAVALP